MNITNLIGRHCANPHYYDYLHAIELNEDGSFKFLTGAGQCPGIDVIGKWFLNDENNSLKFQEVTEVNPFDNDEVIESHKGFEVKFSYFEETTSFRNEVVWRVFKESDWPASIFTSKIIFDEDPIKRLSRDDGNLYYVLENKNFDESEKTYYPMFKKEETNFEELKKLDIKIIDIYEGKDVLSKPPKKKWWKLW